MADNNGARRLSLHDFSCPSALRRNHPWNQGESNERYEKTR